MATLPRRIELEPDLEFDFTSAQLAGWTVNALMDKGDVEGARVELERLLMEGLESGNPRIMDESLMQEIMTKARSGWRRPSK